MPMTSDRKNLLRAETPAQGHTTEQGQVYVPPQDASHMRKSAEAATMIWERYKDRDRRDVVWRFCRKRGKQLMLDNKNHQK